MLPVTIELNINIVAMHERVAMTSLHGTANPKILLKIEDIESVTTAYF